MKIITIVGARPQFIKAATISRAVKEHAGIEEKIIHTGQHFDSNMSDVFFEEMGIPKPHFNLGLGGGLHGAQTGQMLIGIEEILVDEKPDWVLVYGDTNSTLAGALAASKLHIPVAHIEAGLRSFNKKMPEEINRILTDHVSELLFVPTETADRNLKNEGFSDTKTHVVGDVMYDAALYFSGKADAKSTILSEFELEPKGFALCTLHRAENTDNKKRLESIITNIDKVAKNRRIVLPLHPRTKKALSDLNFDLEASSIQFVDPVGFLDMVMLEKNAMLIMTDSGGVQKEAYFHGVPCLTLRDETEWVELVEEGCNRLIRDFNTLEAEFEDSLRNTSFPDKSLYGKGDSAKTIIDIMRKFGE